MKNQRAECLQRITAKLGGAWSFPKDAPWMTEVRFYLGKMPIGSVMCPKTCGEELVKKVNGGGRGR